MRLVVIQQREDDDAIFTPGVRLEVQRKKRVIQTFLGKRKRLTPPARILIHGPPTSPDFTPQQSCSCALPTLSLCASPASNTRAKASGSECYAPPRWQTVCRLSRRLAWGSYSV